MVDVIGTVISGIIAGIISAATLAWKMRSQDTRRKIDAHTRLLRVLEEANKNASERGYGRTKYPHWFTTSSRELLTTCMTDPLISDAVHSAYKESGRVLESSPNDNQPAIHIANLTKLQAAVREELGRLGGKRRGRFLMCTVNPVLYTLRRILEGTRRGRFLMCRGNPARQSGEKS